MDCCYLERNGSSMDATTFPSVSSPEMFESDAESEADKKNVLAEEDETAPTAASEYVPTPAELVVKSDNYLLARINKFLSGVPPPPKHTICQRDCNELLMLIEQNRHLFWTECPLPEKKTSVEEAVSISAEQMKPDTDSRSHFYQHTKSTPRNLSNAFDACDLQTDTSRKEIYLKNNGDTSSNLSIDQNAFDESDSKLSLAKRTSETCTSSATTQTDTGDDKVKKSVPDVCEQPISVTHNTITENDAVNLTWPEAYSHKFHGIHYNRNKAVEEFENLTIKLCERYIGAETQSTCNPLFSRQSQGSARKRSLLAKRENGQSPGKRLSHLARRRRTFSSANLQGLGLVDKKQLILNVKKPVGRKGKSPRGKSPRGKSPRGKSPRSSTKKRVVRRLILENPSPRKLKVETSKRALFQSPPSDRAGSSKLLPSLNVNPQKIKRALFPTPKKKDDNAENTENYIKPAIEETRKRKSEEDLEGPRFKWAKSLSFDCTHELQNTSLTSWNQERHSSVNILSKSENALTHGRAGSELSDTHRKKLLWAVAEALRSKGIGMGHPRFKQYASSLARTVKKFMPDLENRNIPRKPGSTSDRMLKLAKHHVLFIIDARPNN